MADRYRSILFFGPPGVGKGTQGKLVGQLPGYYHLATGDMFRGLDQDSDFGKKFLTYSTRGELVPDELTVKLWQQHVQGLINLELFIPAHDILILDGIPRSVAQAVALDDKIIPLGIIHLICPDINKMIQRIQGRAEKENRKDDCDEAIIRRRLEIYDQKTAPVLEHYDASLIHAINAMDTPEQVLSNILSRIEPLQSKTIDNPMG